MAAQNARDTTDLAQMLAADPERDPLGNVCVHRTNECAGDVRFYDWDDGLRPSSPVLFTARNGATLTGTVWATRGPGDAARHRHHHRLASRRRRPSTGAWPRLSPSTATSCSPTTSRVRAARTPSARARTRTRASRAERASPSSTAPRTRSTSCSPPRPGPTCRGAAAGSGTSHADKQKRRVAAGLNAAYDPLHALIDPDRVGLAGHSLGAGAVSYVGQIDPRVRSIVAWDNLNDFKPSGGGAGPPTGSAGSCASGSSPRPCRPRSPSPRWGCRPTTASSRRPTRRTPIRRARARPSRATGRRAWTRRRSSSAAGPTTSSRSSPATPRRSRWDRHLPGDGHGRLVHDGVAGQVRQG